MSDALGPLGPLGSIADALARATAVMRAAGVPDARREAELLVAHLLDTDRGGVLVRRNEPLDSEIGSRFESLVARRAAREPFQYVIGEQEFRGLPFAVDPRVLVPRPETEELVEAVLRSDVPHGARVADLGTGSGCIAIALAIARPDLAIAAIDASESALLVALDNAERHGVAGRIHFHAGDWAALSDSYRGTFRVVVSNPPYVAEDEWRDLAPEVRDHEPKEALVPGPTGLEAYDSLARAAAALLVADGSAFVELGYRSADGASASFRRAGFESIEIRPDMRGIPRILIAGTKNL